MSKKVKGQKVDLATFNGQESSISSLPSGPNLNREFVDSRRRRDFQSGGGDARNGPSSRAGDGRSFNDDSSNWKRENNSSSFSGDRRGGGDGGEIGGGINESEGAWKRSGFDSADSSNRGAPRGGESSWGREDFSGRRQNDFSNDGRQSSQSRPPASSERPDHLRLKLEPRVSSNRPQFINSAAVKSAEPEASDDKWSKVFTKSSNSKEVDSKVSQVRVDNVFSGLSISAQETESEKPIQAPKEKNAAVNPKTVAIDKKKEAEELKKKAAEEEKEKRRLENEQKEVIRLQMVENCTTILKTNLKGAALMEHIVSLQTKPFAHIFLYTVLQCQMDGNLKWLSASEFGPSLKFLGSSDSGNLVEFLREVEKYCGKYKFPKIEIKGNPRSLLEVIFQLLYKDEIVSDSHFLKWLDEDSDISGHTTAIVQTTNFMNLFRDDNDDGGDDDDDDEDEVDAPRQVIT